MDGTGDRLDTGRPHPARVYDYLLGGKDNFAADREFGEKIVAVLPEARDTARANRAFMRRAAAWMASRGGVRQFLDLGAGLPTSPNLHEVVQRVAPECRVVYVDNDPLVLVHARALLVGAPEGVTAYVDADIRRPEEILEAAAETLDLSRPVGVTSIALLHYVLDGDDAYGIIARLMGRLAAGSCLAVTHGTNDMLPPDRRQRMEKFWAASPVPAQIRTRREVERFFGGLDLVDPGVVPLPQWAPGDEDDGDRSVAVAFYGGLAVKPL